MRPRTAGTVASLVIVAALMLAACQPAADGGLSVVPATPEPTATPVPLPTPTMPPTATAIAEQRQAAAKALLAQSHARMQTVSYRGELRLDVSILAQKATVHGDFSVESPARIAMTMRTDTVDAADAFEFVIARPDLFVKAPGKPWVKLPPNDPQATSLLLELAAPGLLSDLFSANGKGLGDYYKVDLLGEGTSDGVPIQRIGVHIDLQGIWPSISEEGRDRFRSMAGDGVKAEQAWKYLDLRNLEVWVDANGYRRRSLMELRVLRGEVPIEASTDFRAFDLGNTVKVEVPKI